MHAGAERLGRRRRTRRGTDQVPAATGDAAGARPELQAEVRFGLDNSVGVAEADVLATVRVLLAQGDAWRDEASRCWSSSAGTRRGSCLPAPTRWPRPWRRRWRRPRWPLRDGGRTRPGSGRRRPGRWAAAATQPAATGPYGFTWRGPGSTKPARTAATRAHGGPHGRWWGKPSEPPSRAPGPASSPPLPEALAGEPLPADAAAVASVTSAVHSGVARGKHARRTADMLAGLSQADASRYEPALTTLGILLGAEASKPPGTGRCDSTWCWGTRCGSRWRPRAPTSPRGLVPHRDIRQAGNQLRLLAADRGVDAASPGSATVIVSPRLAVDPTGALGAESHVHLTHPDLLLELARDATAAWAEVLAGSPGGSVDGVRALARAALARHGLMPTDVIERLTGQPVAAASDCSSGCRQHAPWIP